MPINELHTRLGNTALYFMLILAVWGLWRFARKQGLDSNYWGALAIGEILLLLQGGLGAYMWIIGLRPDRSIHILYGVVAALVIPGVYLYTRGEQERSAMLVYGVALLIGALLMVRAIMTATVAG